MNISQAGLDLIERFEGYLKALPDGGCMAYQEKLGVKRGQPVYDIPTIGFGCTEGVHMGMIWTREQAEAALKRELSKHEAIVTRLVTAEITQGQFDALVSFSYNCGRLGSSTLLKKVNAGDTLGAADEFSRYCSAKGIKLAGLVRRRAAEKALFLSDVHAEEPAHCPQSVDTAAMKIKPEHAAVGAAAAGAGLSNVQAVVDQASTFKSLGSTLQSFASVEVVAMLGVGAAAYIAVAFVWPALRKHAA